MMEEDSDPLFVQIAQLIENAVLDGSLPEETQVPSTNELAAFHQINPATARKGLGQLVADGVLYKKRGIGMFVATGARKKLRDNRRLRFTAEFVDPLLTEADKLDLDPDEVHAMIEQRRRQR